MLRKLDAWVTLITSAWCVVTACVASGLRAGYAPKNRTDRHTDTGNITLAKYITSHNFTGSIDIIKT